MNLSLHNGFLPILNPSHKRDEIYFGQKKNRRTSNKKNQTKNLVPSPPLVSPLQQQPIKHFLMKDKIKKGKLRLFLDDKGGVLLVLAGEAALIQWLTASNGLLLSLLSSNVMLFASLLLVPWILTLGLIFGPEVAAVKFNPGLIQSKNPWPKNTKVLASSSQFVLSYGNRYSQALMSAIKSSNSLDEAQNQLVNQGYSSKLNLKQKAISRPESLGGWKKNDSTPINRLLLGMYDQSELGFKQTIDIMKETLTREFKVDKTVSTGEDYKTIQAELEEFERQIKRNRAEGKKSEVILYYSGHGGAESLIGYDTKVSDDTKLDLFKAEGDAEFWFSNMSETAFRALVRRHLGEADAVYIILDACASGAAV